MKITRILAFIGVFFAFTALAVTSAFASGGWANTYTYNGNRDFAESPAYRPLIPGADSHVSADIWQPVAGMSQYIYSTGPEAWYLKTNIPAGNPKVASFPNIGELVTTHPQLDQFKFLSADWTVDTPQGAGQSYDTGFDIWFNGLAQNPNHNEVMLQFNNAGTLSVAHAHPVVEVNDGGEVWGLDVNGSYANYTTNTGAMPELIWVLMSGPKPSGSVNILPLLTYLENHDPTGKSFSYLPVASQLYSFNFGFEIVSTNSTTQEFKVTHLDVSA